MMRSIMLFGWLRMISIEPVVFFYVLAIFAEYDVIGDIFFVGKCIDHLKLNSTGQLSECTLELKQNKTDPISKLISTEANNVQQIYNCVLYAFTILPTLMVAVYADRRSKLLPTLIPLIGSAMVQIIILCSLLFGRDGSHHDDFPMIFHSNGFIVLYVCAFISAISGGTASLFSSCFSHVAENCHPSQRTSRMTIVEACLFGGGFFGFSVAGSILKKFPNSLNRYVWNFGLFLLAHLTMAAYVIIRRNMFKKPDVDPTQPKMSVGLLIKIINHTIKRPRPNNLRSTIYLILLAFVMIAFWTACLTTTLFIYTRHILGWETYKYSYFSGAKFGVCGIFLCLLPVIQYLLRSGRINIADRWLCSPLKDQTIISMGLLSRAISITMIGLASILALDQLMIVALVCIAFAEYPVPAIRSLICKLVEPKEKTQMLALLSVIQTICFFIGGFLFLYLYNASLETTIHGPGWLFISMGLLQLIAMFILCHIQKRLNQPNMEQVSIRSSSSSSSGGGGGSNYNSSQPTAKADGS